jgi:signal transduction histidine kinase
LISARAHIEVECLPNHVRLTVGDHGRRFDPRAPTIASNRERVRLLDGAMEMGSACPASTRIILTLLLAVTVGG